MEATTVWAVISTLIITLGSTSVLNYLQTKRRDKCKEREREDREKLSYIDDYEARIKKLEDEIDEREKENRLYKAKTTTKKKNKYRSRR